MLSLSGMGPGGIIYYQFCPNGAGRGYCPGTRPRWGGDLRWDAAPAESRYPFKYNSPIQRCLCHYPPLPQLRLPQ